MMDSLRKIPLEMFIKILQDLYDGGADYVDISGENDVDGVKKDSIKLTVKPEYLADYNEEEKYDDDDIEEELNWPEDESSTPLSDEDINDLI